MPIIDSLADIAALRESIDIECKLAQGRDGTGALPHDIWETYSAFANTYGGSVFLGLRETADKTYELAGIERPDVVLETFWQTINQTAKISQNIIAAHQVSVLRIESKYIIHIRVPQATRQQKPIYLGGTPFNGNTYRREHESDQKCDNETVQRMLDQRTEDESDRRILAGTSITDLEPTSIARYRKTFTLNRPGHPWIKQSNDTFLHNLRVLQKPSSTATPNLTLAGLLMFGRWSIIRQYAPDYRAEYREYKEQEGYHWADKVITDGNWSGNLFDFYHRVYGRLSDTLVLHQHESQSVPEANTSPVADAIREALINSIIHADFSIGLSILVVRRPDMIAFRNPGEMRVPVDQALQGGVSDCRNKLLRKMFSMLEPRPDKAPGLATIYRSWQWQHWRRPWLYEKSDPPQTLLEMRMLPLLPQKLISKLENIFAKKIIEVNHLQQVILATALSEGEVTFQRLLTLSGERSSRIAEALRDLEAQGLLRKSAVGRHAVYALNATQAGL